MKDQEYYSFSDGDGRAFDPPQVSHHCVEKYLILRTECVLPECFLWGGSGRKLKTYRKIASRRESKKAEGSKSGDHNNRIDIEKEARMKGERQATGNKSPKE